MSLCEIDQDSGIIYLTGEVNSEMYHTLAVGLADCDAEKGVTIVLNSEGGEIYPALAMYDMIKLHGNCKILGTGAIMSAASVVFCAAEERVLTANSYVMIHYGEDSNESPSELKHNKELFNLMKSIIGARVNVTNKTLSAWFNKDTYLNAKDALKCGFATRIS